MSVDVEEQTARAKLLISQRQYQEAVRACRRVLLTYPDRADVRLLLGQALLALGRFDEVRAEMLALSRESPHLAAAQRVLGEAFLRGGQVERAREFLERARALDPSDTAAVELIAELDGEEPGVSSTVERWFDPDAVATVQTNPPPYEEEHTGPVFIGGGALNAMSSVQVDPSLGAHVIASPAPVVRRTAPAAAPAPAHPRIERDDWDEETSEDGAFEPEKTVARPGKRTGAPAPAPAPAPSAAPSAAPAPGRAPGRAPAPTPGPDATSQLDISEIEQVEGVSGEQSLLVTDDGEDDSVDELELEGEATIARPSTATASGAEPPASARPPAMVTPYPAPAAAPPPRGLASMPPPGPRSAPPPPARAAFPNDPIPLPPTTQGPVSAPSPSGLPGPAPYPPPPLFPSPPTPFPPAASPFGPAAAPTSQPAAPGPPGFPSASIPAPLPSADAPVPATRLQISAPAATPAPSSTNTDRPDTSRVKAGKTGVPMAVIAAGAVVLLLIVGIGAFFGVRGYLRGRELGQIHAAADAACDEGSKGTIEAASELASKRTSEPEVAALRARLLAIATFEHAADHAAEVSALLATASAASPPLTDAQIASVYMKLASGDAAGARTEASAIVAEGEGAAESARARAIAATALGDLPQALVHARTAAQLRPGSPRHTSLLALLTAMSGNVPTARTLLDTIPGGERSPMVRVIRARVLVETPGESARAASEAETVLGALAAVASPPERAWALLVRARVAVDGGDSTSALAQARQAALARPKLDEAFGLMLGDVLLHAGAPTDARAALAALPPGSLASAKRALLTAEVALALGDVAGAEAALPNAGEGPRVDMLRGRVLEARGQPDRAIEAYRRAAADPVLAVRAKVRLGALHLAAGHAREAAQLLDEARAIAPADTELVPLEVRALVRINQLESAEIVVRDALARRADAPEFLAARASVQLARGDVQGALSALRTAATARPNDADIQGSLGDAARRAGMRDEAKRAFDAALVIAPTQATALAGLAILAAESGDVAAAHAAIERATQAGAGGPELAQARLRLAILEGAGEGAIAEGRTLAQQLNDATTWSSLGRLQLQAERDRDASDSFRRALEIDAHDPEALLGRGLVGIRNGDLGGAAARLDAASAAATERRSGNDLEARILTARGRLLFEYGNFGSAASRAREAVEKDSRCADAHLLLANVTIETTGDPIPELRAAVTGTAPPPEAVGRLSARVPAGQEACELAARYLRAAPQGYDADRVRAVQEHCPR